MAKKLTKVNINSVTVKDSSVSDPKLLISWNYPQKNDSEISEIVLVLKKTVFDTVSVVIGQTVDVWEGFFTSTDKKRFGGFVSNIRLINGTYEITCKDKMWDLIRKLANKVYLDTETQAGQVSAIAKDLIETFGGMTASVVATGTAAGKTISEFRCDQAPIYGRLKNLAQAVKYQLYFKASADTVNFENRGNTNNGVVLNTSAEIINVPDWEDDDSMLVNDLRIDGAVLETDLRFPTSGTGQIETTANFENEGITLPFTPESAKLTIDSADPPTTIREGGGVDSSTTNFFFIDKENKRITPTTGTTFDTDDFAFVDYTWLAPHPIHQVREDSKTTYGAYQKNMIINDIKSIADAESRTNEILDRFSVPFKIGKLLVKDDNSVNIEVGDTVRIIDNVSNPKVDSNFVITKITKKFPGDFQEVVVGDESIRLADWQFNVEDRIKRLEERNLSNQDLLTELRDFILTTLPEPRYLKMFKETVSGVNLFILGHSDFGILGTNKLGDAGVSASSDVFVQQYQNLYTEDFLDTDFLDSDNTTAPWAGDGQLVL